MKVTKASDIVSEFDETFLAAAFADIPSIETLAILRELVGGKTKASVLLVDIIAKQPVVGSESKVQNLSGQYILKIDEKADEWGEPTEADRHRKATEWDKSGQFAKKHIPKLQHSFEQGKMLLMVYDIAGLSQLRLSSYQHLGSGVHAACCGLVSTSLLTDLNADYKTESTVSARQSLVAWLGYRLDPVQGKRLADFAIVRTLNKPAFTEAGRIYLNPLWVCHAPALAADTSCTRFLGLQHGDLHTGNLFFDRLDPEGNPFSIIDWALSRECPLFFDQAYFEVSLLLRELSGKPPEQLAAMLEAADTANQENIPQEHMALAASMREIRSSLSAWQKAKEKNRPDPFTHQWLLARVAAGLNWANKPLEESERRLAFTYAAKAATDFMILFHKSEYEAAVRGLDTIAMDKQAIATPVEDDEWKAFWREVGGFDESEYAFMLIAGGLKGIGESSSLGFLPWSAVLDLDPESEADGLYANAAHVLSQRRSLSWFGKDLLPVNFQRGTAWMMANGWPSRKEDVPSSFTTWRRDYQKKIQELSSAVRAGTAPKSVKILVLPSAGISGAQLGRLMEAVDVELGESAEFILVGDCDAELSENALFKRRLKASVPCFLSKLHGIFGSSESTSRPQLPGLSGPVDIAPDTLRNWEEDFDILHSMILESSSPADLDASSFFRGMPPTWQDLEANLDVPREIAPGLLKELAARFKEGRNFTLELWHSPGAGATTAAYRAAWGLRISRPTIVLRRFSRLTADRIDAVYQKTQKPVLVVADASDLPITGREELFRELGRRNARIGLLYLVRSPRNEAEATLQVVDPMKNAAEVARFVEAYLPRCKNDSRRSRIQQIGDIKNAALAVYRSPFFFGLTTYEEEFLSLDRYVGTHLAAISPLARQTILYLALATRFSQKGLSEAFFRRLFQPAISGALVLEQALGVGPARLIVHGNGRLKFVHPLLAEEALRELLGGRGKDDWKLNLKEICVQLIRDVVAIVGPYSDEAKELFTQLFIFRDPWTDNAGMGKRQFAPLIEAIATVDGQQQVLTLLTEVCGLEPHYWNHLGRHLIYKTNENFAKAEGFLLKAVELSKEEDALHFHALGMVRRFWAKHTLDEMFRNANLHQGSLSSDKVLSAVAELATGALDAFTKARELDPEDAHGYITPIQTILMIIERMYQADGHTSISELCAGDTDVARWIQKRMSEAEELLARVQHFRGQKRQSEHERKCEYDLSALYGDFDSLISTWERILDGSAAQAWLRKAVANAYLARKGRNWRALEVAELRKIVELAECNLSHNPTSESDLRTWFQAYKFLPEFSYNEAIDRLQAWASRSDSVDAHYYLYILHFLRWYNNGKLDGERDETLIEKHLKKSAELSVGRRDISYEWFGSEPPWCPLVNSRELGGWVDQKQFFQDTSKLAFLEGTISALKRTAGTIRVGNVTRAFFRPPAHLRESEHLNAKVHFVLGFSYERLHAWLVDLGPAPASSLAVLPAKPVGPVAAPPESASVPPQSSGFASPFAEIPPIYDPEYRAPASEVTTPTADSEDQKLNLGALMLTKSLLDERREQNERLFLTEIGRALWHDFPGEAAVHKRLGFRSLRALVESWGEFEFFGSGWGVKVQYKAKNPVPAEKPKQTQNLRDKVGIRIAYLLDDSERRGRILQLPTLAAELAKRFHDEVPLIRRLGFRSLTELVRSYDDFDVVWQEPRWIVVRRE